MERYGLIVIDGVEHLSTIDLSIATYLRCLGFKLTAIPRYEKGNVMFFFSPTAEAQKALQDFLNDQALANPRAFNKARNELKRMVNKAIREALFDLTLARKSNGGDSHE